MNLFKWWKQRKKRKIEAELYKVNAEITMMVSTYGNSIFKPAEVLNSWKVLHQNRAYLESLLKFYYE